MLSKNVIYNYSMHHHYHINSLTKYESLSRFSINKSLHNNIYFYIDMSFLKKIKKKIRKYFSFLSLSLCLSHPMTQLANFLFLHNSIKNRIFCSLSLSLVPPYFFFLHLVQDSSDFQVSPQYINAYISTQDTTFQVTSSNVPR